MRITDLSEQVGQGTIRVAGHSVEARVLSAAEDACIRRAMPEPKAPKKPKQQGGVVGLAPDRDDEGYRAALQDWFLRYAAVELAVACRLETGSGQKFDPTWIDAAPGSDAQKNAADWCLAVVTQMLGTLNRRAIEDAIDELRALEAGVVAKAYAYLRGVDVEDLSIEEAHQCRRINVAGRANTLALAAELAERYQPGDLATWWDSMPIGQRAVLVAVEIARKLDAA